MPQVLTVSFADGSDWKLPVNIAVLFHVAIILGTVFGPGLFDRKPKYEDIYTVDLINIQDTVVAQPQQASPEPAKQPPQKSDKPAVSIADTPPEPKVQEKEVVKPVSIKPLKQKKVNKKALAETIKKKLELEHKKNLQTAREAERKASEAARIAASEAVQQLKDVIRESNSFSLSAPSQTPLPRASSSAGGKRNVIENQYYASVFSSLQPHWKLPEYKAWDKDLVATVVIRVTSDGRIIDQFFEKKSGDRLFDQFVLKALQDGSPLPPIPAALNKNNLELGLKFVPGSIN